MGFGSVDGREDGESKRIDFGETSKILMILVAYLLLEQNHLNRSIWLYQF